MPNAGRIVHGRFIEPHGLFGYQLKYMRHSPILILVLLAAVTPAAAQVTLDLHALQALPERGGAPSAARAAPSAPERRRAPNTEAATAAAPAAPSSQAVAAQPAMPAAAPQTASIAPIAPPPPTSAAPPPAPPVSDKAQTNAESTPSGLRVTFSAGQSDLSAESVDSIKKLIAGTPMTDMTSYNVLAYAPGSPDDPSTARRVSLSRAMAVRSALIADGVSSARIYVRALGAQYGDGPADRVDVSVLGANAGTSQATTQ
jgi:outer membrane protein OmpA-like peptidoglycan-associated protein